jgi:acetyl-CoA carboxylase carboxyltransferase component
MRTRGLRRRPPPTEREPGHLRLADSPTSRVTSESGPEDHPGNRSGPPAQEDLAAGQVSIPLRARAGTSTKVGVGFVGGRRVVLTRSLDGPRRGALRRADGANIAAAARLALDVRLPLVMVVSSSGSDVTEGIDALCGWGEAATAVARCSGIVPVLAAVVGPAVSGPALLLGLADAVVMTSQAFAFVSGPEMVVEFTGVRLGLEALGGAGAHASKSGLAALVASSPEEAMDLIGELLCFLPDSTDHLPAVCDTPDPPDRPVPELDTMVPASPTSSYDARDVARALVDDGDLFELRSSWAPQLVTALARLGGVPIGIVANQPRALAGTLDIAASQKGARFVRFCDSFNLPILTLVDTPGFLPGKDLEWRGMIRHGAELAFAYAEATVPRICLIMRKAYGGAYIVMDSKGLGNDLCLAWPTAEIAVMGAEGAVQILARGASPEERTRLEQDYKETFLGPWIAAERGFVDAVIEPAETRSALSAALGALMTRREQLPRRKHDSGPL